MTNPFHKNKIISLTILLASVAIIAFAIFLAAAAPATATNRLAIPKLIDSKEVNNDIELALINSEHEFYEGIKSKTRGFSQSYLGPTIRLYRNNDTRIRFTNSLNEYTTVHGHGLHVPGELDGGPQNAIAPGETWDVTLPIRQEASTNWYHPHYHGTTASQVHSGLAGLYLIEDENSQSLPIPKNYGVDDIPLIVQDRNFSGGAMEEYAITEAKMMDGKREDTLVINGTVDAYVDVPKGWVRLRVLNGSNARFYEFHLENNEAFYKIATEGGFLEKPVEITSILMVPGERNEIMVNMSDGKTRELLATLPPVDDDNLSGFFKRVERVIELRVDENMEAVGSLPEKLNTIVPLDPEKASVTRSFELSMDIDEMENNENVESMEMDGSENAMQHMFGINGKSMDMSRIDERVNKGDVEIWRVTRDEMDHPFHMHGASFQILSRNGRAPAPEDMGWKDTVLVGYGWTELIVKFDYEATEEFPYMYHCHILEHEDGGMMGQFVVGEIDET